MAKVSARTARWAKWAAVPAALLVSGVAVSQASYSAFSATTQSSSNNWQAGTVALDNTDKSASATFAATNMKPGDVGAKCITVTSTGSLASAVKLYASAPASSSKALADNIDLSIVEGTGGDAACKNFTPVSPSKPSYTGTLASFGTTASNFATGVGSWTPTGASAETRTYKITYGLKSDAPSTTMGGTASLTLTWEAQNS
ncbi:hypothetical protein ACRQ5B_09170 [Pseudarthrobacter sp. L19]|uniref:hypothetical protein n=1 Tax=Pseudarthrobacter sp. L19 TaxID=3423951 RepID=UPI003D78B3A7